MNPELKSMQSYKKRMGRTGQEILFLHDRLTNNQQYNQQTIPDFLRYVNLLANHPYLRKSKNVLTFVDHCLPIDKCNSSTYLGELEVYEQVEIFKPPSFFKKIFSSDDEP